MWRGPEWARPAVGGVLLGGLLLLLPQMYGVGYPVLQHALGGGYALVFLLALVVGKMIATSLTIGIGGSGGVFAPSLFIGAMLGSAFGQSVHHLLPGIAGPAGAYGLIGMGAVFAGSARAPITAVVIMFELTGEYSIILPLMAAIVLAAGVSRLLTGETVYTAKLRRRGVDIDAPAPGTSAASLCVRDVMEPMPGSLPESTTLADAADALARSAHGTLPVLAADGAYRGTVTARTVAETLADDEHAKTPVGDVAHLPRTLTPDALLDQVLRDLAGADSQALPVLDAERTHLIGWVSHRSVLTALDHTTAHPIPE